MQPDLLESESAHCARRADAAQLAPHPRTRIYKRSGLIAGLSGCICGPRQVYGPDFEWRREAEDVHDRNLRGSRPLRGYYFFPTTLKHLPYSSSRCAAYSSGLAAAPLFSNPTPPVLEPPLP